MRNKRIYKVLYGSYKPICYHIDLIDIPYIAKVNCQIKLAAIG